mgnify:CR=1 FL=1
MVDDNWCFAKGTYFFKFRVKLLVFIYIYLCNFKIKFNLRLFVNLYRARLNNKKYGQRHLIMPIELLSRASKMMI